MGTRDSFEDHIRVCTVPMENHHQRILQRFSSCPAAVPRERHRARRFEITRNTSGADRYVPRRIPDVNETPLPRFAKGFQVGSDRRSSGSCNPQMALKASSSCNAALSSSPMRLKQQAT